MGGKDFRVKISLKIADAALLNRYKQKKSVKFKTFVTF